LARIRAYHAGHGKIGDRLPDADAARKLGIGPLGEAFALGGYPTASEAPVYMLCICPDLTIFWRGITKLQLEFILTRPCDLVSMQLARG